MPEVAKAVKPRSKLQWLKRLTADLDDDEDSSDATPQSTPQQLPRTQEKAPPLKETVLGDEKSVLPVEPPLQPQKGEEENVSVRSGLKSTLIGKKAKQKRRRGEDEEKDNAENLVKLPHTNVKGVKRRRVTVASPSRGAGAVEKRKGVSALAGTDADEDKRRQRGRRRLDEEMDSEKMKDKTLKDEKVETENEKLKDEKMKKKLVVDEMSKKRKVVDKKQKDEKVKGELMVNEKSKNRKVVDKVKDEEVEGETMVDEQLKDKKVKNEKTMTKKRKEEDVKVEKVVDEKSNNGKVVNGEQLKDENDAREEGHTEAVHTTGCKDVVSADGSVGDKPEPSPSSLSHSCAGDPVVNSDVSQNTISDSRDVEDKSKVDETTKKNVMLDMLPIPRKSPSQKANAPPSAADFVIPKRSVKTRAESAPAPNPARASRLVNRKDLGRAIPVSIQPAPSPSPEPSPTFSHRPPVQTQRKRTKNPVPLKKSIISSQDRALMRLARKRNSVFSAAAELAAQGQSDTTRSKNSPVRMTGYEVFDKDGTALPDLIPRLSCPTKREMASNRDAYPALFFGVSLPAPKAKEESSRGPDDSGMIERIGRTMNCYEELRFKRPEDREYYQQRMYGTTFVPQHLRGWTTLIVRSARFERKSTGIRFNQDRDRDEFAATLSKRYTFNRSVPRCDIPRENWQKLMRNQPGTVYLHYCNREDAEQASLLFRDDQGNPLELRLEYRAGVVIARSSSPATRMGSQDLHRRSGSAEQCAPESSPVSSHGGSARSTPSWRRERQRTPRGDYRNSRYGRGAPSGRYGPSMSGNKRPSTSLERRSRSRSKSFHGHRHGSGSEEPGAGADAPEPGKLQSPSANPEGEGVIKDREAAIAETKVGGLDSIRGGAGTAATAVPSSPRGQKRLRSDKGQEEGEVESSTTADTVTTDKGGGKEEMKPNRSPPRRQHQRNLQAPQQQREHERLRGNPGLDRRRSRSRSRPRGSRGGNWNGKEGRHAQNFGPGDRSSNSSHRGRMHPDEMDRYGGRGYQSEGHHDRRTRPH